MYVIIGIKSSNPTKSNKRIEGVEKWCDRFNSQINANSYIGVDHLNIILIRLEYDFGSSNSLTIRWSDSDTEAKASKEVSK